MAKEETKIPKEEKATVEVDKNLLQELIDSNKTLQLQVNALNQNAVATEVNKPILQKKKNEKDVGIRVFRKKIVVGWENVGTAERPEYVYSEYDDSLKDFVQYINLFFINEEKALKVRYTDYLRDSEKVWARVLKETHTEEVQTQGYVQKTELTDNGYGMMTTQVVVPLDVTIKNTVFTVQLKDGQEIDISEKFIG